MKDLIFANLSYLINYTFSANHISHVEGQKTATYKPIQSKDNVLRQEHPAIVLSNLSKVKKIKHRHQPYISLFNKNSNLSTSVTQV